LVEFASAAAIKLRTGQATAKLEKPAPAALGYAADLARERIVPIPV
jgi:hypothetical protein